MHFWYAHLFVSAILGLLGAILNAALRDSTEAVLSWGFAILVSGHVMDVVLFLVLCVVSGCQPQRKPAVKPFYM